MLFRKILKISPFVVLTLLNVNALRAYAGGVSGGGGDASESRVNEIRADILNWIVQGGAQGLQLPQGMTLETYQSQMSAMLVPQAVVVGFVTAAQEAAANSPELKVSVDGQPKTCRGFVSVADARPHILCNTERFAATGEAEQYRLVHHEYAGLAGIEQNVGAASDYEISSQLTQYLVPETVLRLAVNRGASTNVDTSTIFGRYELLSKIAGNEACDEHFGVSQLYARMSDHVIIWDRNGGLGGLTWDTVPNRWIWQPVIDESYGYVTRHFAQNTADDTITFNITTETYYSKGSNGFRRAFRRNRLVEQRTTNLVLDRATGLLTYIRNTQPGPGNSDPNELARSQVCLMKKVR